MGSTIYGDQWKTPPRIHGKIQATIIKITNNNTTDGNVFPFSDAQIVLNLVRKLPNSKELVVLETHFYGADPIYEENGRLYSTVGQFFPVAVGNETKLTRAYVMPNLSNGKYEFRTMLHLDVITFLKDLTQTHFIDQLLMDNEDTTASTHNISGSLFLAYFIL
ncbi:hypothetical protein NECAME_17153 [Necator americanus]|uniref:Uncharacterized protein n=1 Tax=Necator americanus TaxID=51031 RepID=W2TRZ1_NECAM|nr:hypothetical protein NECAME_17153 [Necator americanus]ETN84444.1 hypothetical protein NECAME_17153 [Necator americanus]